MENIITFTLFGSTIIFVFFFALLFFVLYVIDRAEESIGYALLILLMAGIANHFWGTFPTLEYNTL